MHRNVYVVQATLIKLKVSNEARSTDSFIKTKDELYEKEDPNKSLYPHAMLLLYLELFY